MSQQHMDFDEAERGYQAQAPYPASSERGFGPGPDDAFSGLSGQKLGQQTFSSTASAGQRLALAIVSLCLLVPLSGIAVGIITSSGPFGLISGLIMLGLVCLTIMVVNIVFNYRH